MPGGGLDPDASAMLFDDAPANGKTDAGAGVLRTAVEPLKDLKESVGFGRIEADAVVGNAEDYLFAGGLRGDSDLRPPAVAAEFNGVADEILEKLPELAPAADHRRQWVNRHSRPSLLSGRPEVRCNFVH